MELEHHGGAFAHAPMCAALLRAACSVPLHAPACLGFVPIAPPRC
jgi:hypothetical protein